MKEPTKEKILEILNENLENKPLSELMYDNDLSEMGMDSIAFIRVIVSLEEEFECEIPDSKILLLEMNTVNKIYDVLSFVGTDDNT